MASTNEDRSIIYGAVFGYCPKCGARSLFGNIAQPAESCRQCGLKFGRFARSSRLAALTMMVVVALLIVIAISLDNAFRPPLWLQVPLWMSVTMLTVIASQRLFQGMSITMRYRQWAAHQKQKK